MYDKSIGAYYYDAKKHADIHFKGRMAELGILIRHLFNENYTKPFIQVITGLGGIGKTGLINRFVHQYFSAYRMIQWFHSKNLAKGFRDLAYSLRSFNIQIKNIDQLSDIQIIDCLKNELSKLNGWLLVFDDIETYEQISTYLPPFSSDRLQHIIITSPYASWPKANHTLALNPLSEEESLEIFNSWNYQKNKSWYLEDMESWKKLASILDYFPLALTQACHYIFSRRLSASNYLEFFRTNRKRFWEFKSPTFNSSNAIQKAWNNTIETISKSELARNILYYFVASNSQNISLNILNQLSSNPKEIEIALKLLSNYFFITKHSNSDYFTILPLLQTVIKDTLSSEELKKWQLKLKNLEKLSLKEMCLNKVSEYINAEDLKILSKFDHLTPDLQDHIAFKTPKLYSILKKFGYPIASTKDSKHSEESNQQQISKFKMGK